MKIFGLGVVVFKNGREVFNAAEAGDKGALDVLDGWITEIAYGIAGLVHIFDPEMVIIGGGVSAQEELLVKPLREKVLEGLEFLGIKLDKEKNAEIHGKEAFVNAEDSKVKIIIVPTDEELVIARDTAEIAL